MRRIFLSINLQEEIKTTLKEKREELKANFKSDTIRWIDKENLHITLAFIGSVKEANISILKDELSELKFTSFNLNFGEIKYVPNRCNAKLIWVEGKSKELNQLKLKINDVLKKSKAVIYNPDNQDFIPHITMGRVKSFKFKKIPLEEIPLLEDEFVDFSFKVQSFQLMESKLKRSGPIYKKIESYE